MTTHRIGIVGAYGRVGRACAKQLRTWDGAIVRVGGRDATRVDALARDLGGAGRAPVESRQVDLRDPRSLARFCQGCTTVVNCAGPARDIGAAVARAALSAGAGYVDASGDDALHREVSSLPWAGPRPAVLSAGMAPGLTAVLPRALALDGFANVQSLHGYVGGRDTFTLTAAIDYLSASAAGFGEPLAAWRGGGRASRALARRDQVRLRFWPEPVCLQPYLSTETERIAAGMGLTDVDWYSVFVGERVPAVLARGASAAGLCRAAELDSFGQARFQLLAFCLIGTGSAAPSHRVRTLCCRGTGASELTGVAAALGADAVTRGEVGTGVHHLGEALDPAAALPRLRGSAAVLSLDILDGAVWPAGTALDDEEGEL